MKRFFANLIDEVIVFGVAALILLLTVLIMKLIGFVFKEGILAYAYIISLAVINLIYSPIFESTKSNATIGKKILKVK
jgi:uncharacterized RDD family membrane protein YckC